jgi:peptidoglycan hydrolase CwlO-like protein
MINRAPSLRIAARRLLVAGASVAALLASGLVPASSGDLQNQISAAQSTAASLQSQIAAQTSQIERTAGGIAAAQDRLGTLQAELAQREANLRIVQQHLMQARDHLEFLEHRLETAARYLAANLRATYETGQPNLMTVILNAHGFSDLLQQVSFMERIGHSDAQIIRITRAARTAVLAEADRLGSLEQRDRALTDQIVAERDQVAALQAALVKQQIAEESARSGDRAQLASVEDRLGTLKSRLAARLAAIEARAAAQARQSTAQVNQQVGGIAVNTGGMVQPPPGAPAAVREMIAAGNAIATLPYIWGGGHASFQSPGYDCSGSVSYVLAAAGLLSAPEVSGEFMSYGDPGPGQWVTIYANTVHVWMEIAGWRFDTVALAEDGSRWAQGGGEFAGFVVRHPPGL